MSYGDAHAAQVAKDIAEILRKSQAQGRERERALAGSRYNDGLHAAAMIVHAFLTQRANEAQFELVREIEQAIIAARVGT